VRDAAGKEYLEFTASDWVAATGYGREEIAKVAYEQMVRIPHVDPFGNQKLALPTIMFAKKLAEIAPGTLKKVFTISGGSEANEAAMKLTKQYQQKTGFPRRFKFISRRYNYHGATQGALGLDGNAAGFNSPYLIEPLAPGFLHVAHPYCYRCDFGLEYPSCGLTCAKQIELTIQYEHPSTVAGVVTDSISGFASMAVPPPEYFPMVRKICDKYGILWIDDEVATGFGRTGKMFACEHWNVVPDIMTMSKQISGGYLPLSAVIVKEEIADKFIGTPEDALANGHTWWGHATACAVALKSSRERI
jgi:taurine-pyruvate aminotransferase